LALPASGFLRGVSMHGALVQGSFSRSLGRMSEDRVAFYSATYPRCLLSNPNHFRAALQRKITPASTIRAWSRHFQAGMKLISDHVRCICQAKETIGRQILRDG
jgi:hypothetical protein